MWLLCDCGLSECGELTGDTLRILQLPEILEKQCRLCRALYRPTGTMDASLHPPGTQPCLHSSNYLTGACQKCPAGHLSRTSPGVLVKRLLLLEIVIVVAKVILTNLISYVTFP